VDGKLTRGRGMPGCDGAAADGHGDAGITGADEGADCWTGAAGTCVGWLGVGWAGPDSIWIGRAGGTIGVMVWAPAPDQTSATDAETIRARRIDKDSTTFSVRPF
jgi:hypothetical protein